MKPSKQKSFGCGATEALQTFKTLQKITGSLGQASDKVCLMFSQNYFGCALKKKKKKEQGRTGVVITLQPSFPALYPTGVNCRTYINHYWLLWLWLALGSTMRHRGDWEETKTYLFITLFCCFNTWILKWKVFLAS